MDPTFSDVWQEGGRGETTRCLELARAWEEMWNSFVAKFKKGHIKLKRELDTLVWAKNKSNIYTTCLSYKALLLLRIMRCFGGSQR
jgi:hypothetical protein